MSITRFSTGLVGDTALAGNTSFSASDFELISTIRVGATVQSTITFSNIPQEYKHLQMRIIQIPTAGASGNYIEGRFNNDSAANYAFHSLNGNGSTAVSTAATSQTKFRVIGVQQSTGVNTFPQPSVLDILDYSNTTKNKTLRSLAGGDANGNGEVSLISSLWISTASISSIILLAMSQGVASNFGQYSKFSLYGIRG